MTNQIIEIAANLFQSTMMIIFIFFFFKGNLIEKKHIIASGLFILVLFTAMCLMTIEFFLKFQLDSLIYIAILEIYTLACCKGNIFLRIIIPLITFSINTVISLAFGYTISYLSGVSIMELATQSSYLRMLCIIVINLLNVFIYYLIIRIKSKDIVLNRFTDVTAFIIIPVVSMLIIYSTFKVLQLSGFNHNLLIYLILICLSVAFISVLMWILLEKISRSNEIKTQFLLTKQREEMYQTTALQVNEQIDKISKIRHDIKNNLCCISELLKDGKYNEAKKICHTSMKNLKGSFVPVNTTNPYLNAIVNVELEKSIKNNVAMNVHISDELSDQITPTDIISIIGNMCDNAIEYLSACPADVRTMELSVSRKANYSVIICKNYLCSSVLNENQTLTTTKKDTTMHGKGFAIIQEKIDTMNGYFNISEEADSFIVKAFIPRQNLPEN